MTIYSPPCGLAFPLSCFRDLGIRFDDDLPVLEDWDVLLQSAMLCGVVDTEEVTSVYRWWEKADSSLQRHSKLEWDSARSAVVRRMDSSPLVLPLGSVSRVAEMVDGVRTAENREKELLGQIDEVQKQVNALHQENYDLRNDVDWLTRNAQATNEDNQQRLEALTREFHASASWRVTAPLRRVISALTFWRRLR